MESVLSEYVVDCPYCGESLEVLLDPGDMGSSYTEDCQVCCQPIVFILSGDGQGQIELEVRSEDE